jgi:hypothetical protein
MLVCAFAKKWQAVTGEPFRSPDDAGVAVGLETGGLPGLNPRATPFQHGDDEITASKDGQSSTASGVWPPCASGMSSHFVAPSIPQGKDTSDEYRQK